MSQWVGGIHSVRAVLKQRAADVLTLWLDDSRKDKRLQAIRDLAAQAGVESRAIERHALDQKLPDVRHQGVAVELSAGSNNLASDLNELLALASNKEKPLLLLVLDGVTDPHNLGACLRSCDAAGADALVVPKDNSAGNTAVVSKVASGAAETVPLIRVANLKRAFDTLREAGVWIYGAAGEAEHSLFQLPLDGPVALVMGAEGKGLRRLTREACDDVYHIPMCGSVDSLNVSVAAGVSLFEAVRQRD